jgi:hypothetical protein
MATHEMRPLAVAPESTEVPAVSAYFSFSQRAAQAMVAAGANVAVRGRKPLRPRKEALPVAAVVDQARVVASSALPAAEILAGPALAAPSPSSPVPTFVFDGGADDNTSIPPDTTGAVSGDHVFEGLNNNVLIFNRGGVLQSQMTLDRFWDVFPDPVDAFDPRAVWDPFGQRFIFISTANPQRATSKLLIAVTATNDPTGQWISNAVPVDPALQGEVWLDFPSVGFTEDKITVQVNLFTLAGNLFAGSSIYVWEKSSLYDPPHQPQVRLFTLREDGACQVPASTYVPGEATQYLVSTANGDSQGSGYYAIYEITGSVAGGTVALNPLGYVQTPGTTWAATTAADPAPQLGSPHTIDAGDDRILSVVLRGEGLWFSHTAFLPADGPVRSMAQWLQVRVGAWSVLQLGRLGNVDGDSFVAFPTIAVNANEDALLGFAHFTPNQFGSGGYAYRAAADPPGTLRSIQLYAAGLSTYFKTFGGTKNRWGDYSATQVDPFDDRGFWTVQELAAAQPDTWATRWAHVT